MALMYLFDPETGEQRRSRLARTAAEGASIARDAASTAWERMADATSGARSDIIDGSSSMRSRLSDAASSARSYAEDMADNAGGATAGVLSAGRHLFRSVRDKVSSFGSEAADRASDLTDRARQSAHNVRRGTNIALGRESDHHYVGQTVCALGSLALGAGVVWAFDPRLGRSRRAWLRDKSMHWMRETGDFFRAAGHFASDHLRGTVAQTRSSIQNMRGGEQVSDEKLVARIRSQLGRFVQNMANVQVTAHEGYVTLGGHCGTADVNSIRDAVLSTHGVRGIDVQMQPGQPRPAPTAM